MPWYAKAQIDYVDEEHNVRIVKDKEYKVSKPDGTVQVHISVTPLSQSTRGYYMTRELAREIFNPPVWKVQ